MNPDESTNEYDAAFGLVSELTWLPWVGQHYSERSPQKRLLVVGESHYYNGATQEERQANREKWLDYPQYTREVVSESLVNYECPPAHALFRSVSQSESSGDRLFPAR